MAVVTNLEVQKEILRDVNARLDKLVMEILKTSKKDKKEVDFTKVNILNEIIDRLEGIEFEGNIDLLRTTKSGYDKAIAVINEELESEEIKGFKDYSKKSLEKAKQILEEQSQLGRVGTMISKLDEISREEADGTIERRYNDDKIDELNYSIKKREEQEKQRIEPFNKIVDVTRKPMEELDKYNDILKQIQEIDKEISELQKEIAKPETSEEDKKIKNAKIKDLNNEKWELYKSAKKDDKDKDFNAQKGETYDAYFKRVKPVLEGRINDSRTSVIGALETIKDEEIEVCGTKMKISAYLKDYMDRTNLAKVDELADKIVEDKALNRRFIEQEKEYKDMDELKKKKEVYEERNAELDWLEDMGDIARVETDAPVVYEKKKFDWKHPFKSIANWFRRDTRQSNSVEPRRAKEEFILTQLEKEMEGDSFRKKYYVPDKDRISVKVEKALNKKREESYRQQNEQGDREI